MTAFIPAALDISWRYDFVEIEDGSGASAATVDITRNEQGTWQVNYPIAHPMAQVLLASLVAGEDIDRWGAVFRLPGTGDIVASGPASTILANDGVRNGVADDAISVWGVTDFGYFSKRLTWPSPTEDISETPDDGSGVTLTNFDRTKTGPVETVILDFITENLGSGAIARRQLGAGLGASQPTLTIPTTAGRGPTVTYTVTMNDNLGGVIAALAPLGDLTIDLRQAGPGEMEVIVNEAVTREGIVWSPTSSFGELAGGGPATANGISVKRQRRASTQVICSSYGDDATVTYVRRDADDITGTIATEREEYIKSGSADAAEMIPEADAELEEDSSEIGLDVEPSALAPWRLGQDYELGDRVIGVIFGQDIEAPIRRVLLTHDNGTFVEQATAAYDDATALAPILNDLYSRLQKLTRRVR